MGGVLGEQTKKEESQQNQGSVTAKNDFKDGLIKGSIIGGISSTALFPIDKITFVYQVLKGEGQLTLFNAIKHAFSWPKTLNGYLPGLCSTLAKNAVVFATKGEVENHIDKTYSGFIAGLVGVYATSPFAVVKALAYNNQPFYQTLTSLNYGDYFRGVHTKALCDAVYFSIYLNMLPMLKDTMNESPLADTVLNNNVVIGSLSGLSAGFFSNPLATITMGQRVHGTTFVEEANSLKNDGGLPRFYRGFFKTNALRMGVQGAVIATAIELADTLKLRYGCSSSEE